MTAEAPVISMDPLDNPQSHMERILMDADTYLKDMKLEDVDAMIEYWGKHDPTGQTVAMLKQAKMAEKYKNN